jgi:cytochrome c biogenesis protein CcmG, thiol:disulfide interchange protein DsbE
MGIVNAQATRREILWSLLATAAGLLGAGAAAEAALKAGERPTPVTLSDLAGARVVLPEAFGGKVLVVHFWATWCAPCFREIDALQALFGEYRERGLAPVSVNVGEAQAVVADALRARTVTYPILLDADSATARLYGVVGLPTTFVLDRKGVTAVKVLGEIDRDGLRRVLSGLL